MTEIAARDSNQPTEPETLPGRRAFRDVVTWAQEARAAYSIAESLAKTSFVPAQFRGKPSECTAAILTGSEMGLSPMASLRAFDVIQGTPAMRAHALRAVVQSQGHEIWEETISPTRVVVCGQRAGSTKIHRSEWTIQRADNLGLSGKDSWRRQPQAMLLARATAEVCRMTASDVLYGVPYTSEELTDLDPQQPAPRTARRRTTTQPPTPTPQFPQPEPPAREEGNNGAADHAASLPAEDHQPPP